MLNTARIAKNTIFLYLRMILVLAANFLAVRVLLEVLGADDYGLFNLIVGFVTLFTLPWHAEASGEGRLNGALMFTVQSFLCFELGRVDAVSLVDAVSPVDAVSSPRQKETNNSTLDLLSRPTLSSPHSPLHLLSRPTLSSPHSPLHLLSRPTFFPILHPSHHHPLLLALRRLHLVRAHLPPPEARGIHSS